MYRLPRFHDKLYETSWSWSEKYVFVCLLFVLIDKEWGLLQRLGFLQKLVKTLRVKKKMLRVYVCIDFLKR